MNIIDKTRLLQTSVLSSLMIGFGGVAYAQVETTEVVDQVEEEVFEEEEVDQVVVTGSRLRRNSFSSVSPLQVIDGELSRDLGLVDASDLLRQTTVTQGQQITTGVSTSAGLATDNGPGSANADLRGLSADRTLVLVNGRRLAPAGVRGAPSNPDLNLIPGTLVERVDILLDGASSIYGSDAVAGVVNYELQKGFEGLELDAFTTMPEFRGNAGHQQVISAKLGVADENGFITVALEHNQTDGFTEQALTDFYLPYQNGCRASVSIGITGEVFSPDTCRNGQFAGGSAGFGPAGFLAFEQGANVAGLPRNFSPVGITGDLLQPDSIGGQRLLNFPEEFNANFQPDFERTSLFAFGEYELGFYGDMTAYFEASYGERRTSSEGPNQVGFEIPTTYGPSNFGDPLGLDRGTTLFFESRLASVTNVAQTRLIGGLKGELPFIKNDFMDNWGYDVYGSYSRSSGQDSISGLPFLPRLERTLSNTRFDEDLGEFVCDPLSVPGEGQPIECRPLNFFEPSFLFSGQFEDPDDTSYLFPNRLTDTEVFQTVFSGYVGGDLFDMPWGDTVLVGFGAEYREDEIVTRTSVSGDFLGFSSDPGANGSRNFKEVFGEIELPLISDKPLVEELTLNLAGRYTEESNFGGQETYSIKGQYKPTDWFSIQSTYGTSFRAPSVGDQFGGRVINFQDPGDPCRVPGLAIDFIDADNDPSTPDTREYIPEDDQRDPSVVQTCLNGGGPFNIPGTDPFALGTTGLGTPSAGFAGSPTRVASGSNPELGPETSKAFSVGATFDQPWSDDFDLLLAVTYFEIEVNDEIDQLSANTIVNRCYNSDNLTDPTCGFLTRAPRVEGDDTSGEVVFVSATNQNLGQQIIEGIDYNVEFGFDVDLGLGSPVDYRLIGRATQSLTQTEELILPNGTTIDTDLGEFGSPEWRLNLTNVASWNDFRFIFQSRFIDSQVENILNEDATDGTGLLAGDVDIDGLTSTFGSCVQTLGRFAAEGDPSFPGGFNCIQLDGLDSYWVHDMSVAYAYDTWAVRVGVNNLFDTAPPLTNNNDLANLGGIGYDIGGRTYFANVTKRF